MTLPFLSGRWGRGGSLAFGPAGSVAAAATEQDVLDLNPLWWLDPDDAYCFTGAGSGAVSEGSSVYQWSDKSGNSVNHLESNASYRPVWRASGTNVMPYVDYTDTYHRLWADNPGAHSTPMTIYMVIAAVTSVQQGGKNIGGATASITYSHTTAGTGYDNAIATTFSNDNNVTWGEQVPTVQSLTTQIIQIEGHGTALPDLRINGGAAYTRATTASAAEDDWTAASGTNMFWGVWNGATFVSYDYLAIGDVTHDADTVFSHLGDKYGITVTAVS